jgi:hypothetical protein
MYQYLNWTFKKNFSENAITKHLRKLSVPADWNARAYKENVFTSLIENQGVRVFHNDNPGEVTKYAVGLSQDVPNNVMSPSNLTYGFYFHDEYVELLCDSSSVLIEAEKNVAYTMRFTALGAIEFVRDGTSIHICDTTADFSSPYSSFVVSHTSFQTDIEVVHNLDGIESLIIQDVTWEKTFTDSSGLPDTTSISLYEYPSSLAFGTTELRVHTQGPVAEDSIDSTNVRLYRYLRAGEDPSDLGLEETASKVPLNITVPYNWSSVNYFTIFTTEIDRADTFQLIIGNTNRLITEDTTDAVPYFPTQAIFKSTGDRSEEATAAVLNSFFNDIYFKTRNLDALIDVDKIVYEASTIFDFQYEITEYDADEKTYNKITDPARVAAGYENTNRIVQFQTSKTIEELFVKQYLPEYQRYMEDVNDPTLTILDGGESQDLKDLLFKNITLMNYFKGNKIQMNMLVSIFSGSLGYHYVSVDPDPYYNFIYRVSTTLPQSYWLDSIKNITHPLGWDDFYVEIPYDANDWTQLKIISDATGFEEYFIRNAKITPTSYIDVADYVDENGAIFKYGSFTGNAMYEDMLDEATFPFKPSEYNATVDYGINGTIDTTSGLFYDLRTVYPTIDATTGYTDGTSVAVIEGGEESLFKVTQIGKLWTFEFTRSGVATEYAWRIYRNGVPIYTRKTYIPKLVWAAPDDGFYDISLVLLHKNKFVLPLFSYRADTMTHPGLRGERYLNLIPGKSGIDLEANDQYNRWDGVVDLDHRTNTVKDGEYIGEPDTTAFAALAITIDQTGDEFTVYLNDSTDTEFAQNHIPGVFTEFEWIIRSGIGNSGPVINRIRTYVPTVTYTSTDPGNRNIEVLLIRGDKTFVGPNMDI